MSKEEGAVKWFNGKKGYGFISGDNGKDYFFHYSFVNNAEGVVDADRVSFAPEQGERGLQAKDINKI